nr:PREDICTED: cathepsin B-like cysteine proteinase 4 [Bemisia tabaci]
MEFTTADVKMLAIIAISLLAVAHRTLGSDSLEELMKKHPTWSFEVENIETFIQKSLNEHPHNLGGGLDRGLTEKILREKVKRSLAPGATHIVRKIGDPKWESDPLKVPSYFDAREKWKDCASLIGHAEDEGPCHTDTPAAIAAVMSDRYCIYTNGTFRDRLSQETLLGCGELCTADPFQYYSWLYAKETGIPTGGPHGSSKGCMPYTYAGCDHSSWYTDSKGLAGKNKMNACKGQLIFDHDCPKKCSNQKYKTPIDKDRKKLTTFYMTSRNEFCIRNEIMAYGSVLTSVIMYNDFLEKPDGIFQKKTDRKFLAWDKFFKIIGWGEENGIKYWLCVHTWDTWGDKVFKTPRGVNYDWIEFMLTAGVFDPLG